MDKQSNSNSKFCPYNETDHKRSFFSDDEADITPMLP